MNYIELFGISSAGKSFIKDKIYNDLKKKNHNVLDPKIIIIKFFLKNFKVSYFENIKLIILIIFYSKHVFKVKSFLKRKTNIKKINNKFIFFKSKKKIYHKFTDMLGLNEDYSEILLILKKKLNITKKYYLYNFIEKEVNSLNQNNNFKSSYKRWLLENIILIDILKKNKDIYCVLDEGIIHKIFIIYSLKANNKIFVNKALKFVENYKNLYMIKTDLKKIKKRYSQKIIKNDGFIYENNQQIVKEYNNFMNFDKLISKKLKYKTIIN
jgi:hypothetical protein